MITYRNLSGQSPIKEYCFGNGYIVVRFEPAPGDGPVIYVYDDNTAGPANIQAMQNLAERGQGLAGYISSRVRKRYRDKYTAAQWDALTPKPCQ